MSLLSIDDGSLLDGILPPKQFKMVQAWNKAPRPKGRGINTALQAAGFRQPSSQGTENLPEEIEIHKEELLVDWELAVNGDEPFWIAPLQ